MTIDIKKAAAELVLRELSEVEKRDVFGGTWAKVEVGPVTPMPNPPPTEDELV